jgi:uncharacterized protein (TIGR02284 family)
MYDSSAAGANAVACTVRVVRTPARGTHLATLCERKENAMTMYGNDYQGGEMPGNRDEIIRQLNSLLRGEISAAETYRMAIDKVQDSDDAAVASNTSILQQMQEDHGRAAQALRERIRQLGGEPADSSGAWGTWAQTVQGTMNLFGDTSALKGLKEGEEHGLKDYREALDDVDASTASVVRNELIPAQQRHISMLDQLINAAGRA